MTDYEKEEFWKALQRQYDASLELRQSIEAMGARMDARSAEMDEKFSKKFSEVADTMNALPGTMNALGGKMDELAVRMNNLTGVVNDLSSMVSELSSVSLRHEKRLDRTELTVEAILEEFKTPPGRPRVTSRQAKVS